MLTLLSNCLTNVQLSDMETCYKVFRREIIQAIPIEEDRFGFAPEITVKVYKHQLLGSHLRRGKKIGWNDGFRCLCCLLKYSIKEPVAPVFARQDCLGSPSIETRNKAA